MGCLAMPMTLAPQPHSNTATRTPNAAAMLSRFMTAALSGTRTDRNTAIRSRKLRAMTAPKNHGSLDDILWVTSMLNEALPVVLATTSVPATTGLMMSWRTWRTQVPVAASCGAVLGVTMITAAVGCAGELGWTGETAAAPGSAWRAASRRWAT